MRAVPRILGYAVVAALAGVCQPCAAQNNPTADQIIDSLKPPGGPTRGIRPISSSGVPARPSAVREAARPSLDLTVQFKSGSAELTPAATHTLDQLGKALASPQLAHDRFRIEGHTDTVGSPEVNKPLSQHRAEAVASYLETNFGIDGSRLDAIGVGEDDLLVATPAQTPEPRNRRVHIVNLSS